jgi:hypothetical protein
LFGLSWFLTLWWGTGAGQVKEHKSRPERLREGDWQLSLPILAAAEVIPRVANHAQTLLALDGGERHGDIVDWLGWRGMRLWYL